MQERHTDRWRYFQELDESAEKYFLPYIEKFHPVNSQSVLEIGCGEGGNLAPFARRGCRVKGVDIAPSKVRDAKAFFQRAGLEGTFVMEDILQSRDSAEKYDIILCHDVYEHLPDKQRILDVLAEYVKPDGIVFMAFPAWQMPFGGHQQICNSRVLSRMPFLHLLPKPLYRAILKRAGESDDCITELMAIHSTRTTIERYEKLLRTSRLKVVDRVNWFINPHYQTKFGIKPRKLHPIFASIPWLRNFLTSSYITLLRPVTNS